MLLNKLNLVLPDITGVSKLSLLAAAAACDVSATGSGGGAPASPSSPSRGGNRVGGENIAALRERMSQIQIAYSQVGSLDLCGI